MKNKNLLLNRFLFNVYGFAFLDKLTLLLPVYAIFMQDNGVSDMGLSVLIVLLSVGVLATQIPVTWVMNIIGRRKTIVLGQILKAAGLLLWLVWPNFWGFAIGMILWGVQWATFAVAYEGLLYDELVARGGRRIYTRVLSRRYVIQAIAVALSSFGSLLMFVGYDWVTFASVATCLVACVFIARIKLFAPVHRVEPANWRKMFRSGVRAGRAQPCIFIMMMLSLLVTNIAYLDDYLSPIGLQIGLPVEYVGLISFFALGCGAVGQILAGHMTHLRDRTLYFLIVGAGLTYVLFALMYTIPGMWALGLGYMMFGALNILLYSRFQDILPPRYRSVLLSLHNIGTHVVYIGTCLVIGGGAQLGSWRYGILILGLLLCGLGVYATLGIGNRCGVRKYPGAKMLHPKGTDRV